MLFNLSRARPDNRVRAALVCLLLLCFLSGCSKFDLLNATVPARGYLRTDNVAYGTLPQQKLDVYRPKSATQPASIVIFFYGGDWQAGSKEGYRFVAQALTSKGFIAVMPDYRLYPSVTFPAFVEDAAKAVRWVHDNASQIGGDPAHIYLMGHSAGAHIAALLTLDSHYLRDVGLRRSAIRGTAGLSGPYDFTPSSADRAVFSMSETDTKPHPAIEPINFVDGHAPPMLLIHGKADTTVGYADTTSLADRIREKGGSVRTILYPDKGHVPVVLALAWSFRRLAPTLHDVTEFYRELDSEVSITEQADKE